MGGGGAEISAQSQANFSLEKVAENKRMDGRTDELFHIALLNI